MKGQKAHLLCLDEISEEARASPPLPFHGGPLSPVAWAKGFLVVEPKDQQVFPTLLAQWGATGSPKEVVLVKGWQGLKNACTVRSVMRQRIHQLSGLRPNGTLCPVYMRCNLRRRRREAPICKRKCWGPPLPLS